MTFSDSSAISAHYDTAHAQSSGRPERADARHECDVCGRKFTEKRSLKRHINAIHGDGDVQTFECSVCSKVFNVKGNLTQHLSTVHGVGDVKTFECDVCSKIFNRKSSLTLHLRCVHKM